MSNLAMKSHGTLLKRQNLGTGTFTTVAELLDLTPPPMTRNPYETTAQQDNDETYLVGIRRSGELTFNINWIPSEVTHGPASGLLKSWEDGQLDGWQFLFTQSSATLTFSGWMTNFGVNVPLDDKVTAAVTVRPSGAKVWASS